MALAQITDLVTRARARVLSQYRSMTTRFLPMLDVLVGETQELENAIWGFIAQLDVTTATDIWLERLGEIVGEKREGEADDAIYRRYIEARILANKSSGRINDVLAVANKVIGGDPVNVFVASEWFPAHMRLEIPQGDLIDFGSSLYKRLLKMLRITRAAGVGFELLTQSELDNATFTFSSTGALQASTTLGFASQVVTPEITDVTMQDTIGGSLLGDTDYTYRVAAFDGSGTTFASEEFIGHTDPGTNTNQLLVAWGAAAGATGYRVYGRTGSLLFIANTLSLSYVDNGSITPAGALPTANTTAISGGGHFRDIVRA